MADVPSTLKPGVTAIALIESAVVKHNTRWDITFFKAVLAGIMLSFGGLLNVIMSGGSEGIAASNPGLVKILGGFVFPVGLVMIVLLGLDLLTSHFMIFSMATIKGAIPWWGVPVNWIIVTFGNLTGSLFFAVILAKYDGIVTGQPYLSYIHTFTVAKAVTPAWHQIFLMGIGCNWLVCIAIWQSTAAKETSSKIIASWFPIWYLLRVGSITLTTAEYIRKSLIAPYLGNIIGALFVGLPGVYFYHEDWKAGGLRNAEEAHPEKNSAASSQN